MSPNTWWYLSRAAGIVAWLMLTTSVFWGIVLASHLVARRRRAAWLGAHRWLAWLTIVFVALHLSTLLADKHSPIGVVDLAVPFASSWRPTAIALGVIALWLVIVVELTALAMKRLSRKWWRDVHIASYGIFWAVTIHGALAGTDASRPLYAVTSIAALAAVLFAAFYRIFTRDLERSRPRARTSLPSARSGA